MYFRSQRKCAQDVSLSDYIETGTDGAALSLMDVVSEDGDLLEQVVQKEDVLRLRKAMDTCLTEQERLLIEKMENECLVDDLIAQTGLPAGKVLATLTVLEVRGFVTRLPGRRVKRKG